MSLKQQYRTRYVFCFCEYKCGRDGRRVRKYVQQFHRKKDEEKRARRLSLISFDARYTVQPFNKTQGQHILASIDQLHSQLPSPASSSDAELNQNVPPHGLSPQLQHDDNDTEDWNGMPDGCMQPARTHEWLDNQLDGTDLDDAGILQGWPNGT